MDCEGIPGQENKLILHRTDSCLNFKVHVAMSSSQAFQWHFTKYTYFRSIVLLSNTIFPPKLSFSQDIKV